MRSYEQVLQDYIGSKHGLLQDRDIFHERAGRIRTHYYVMYDGINKKSSFCDSSLISQMIINKKYSYSQLVPLITRYIGEPVEKICRRILEQPEEFEFEDVEDEDGGYLSIYDVCRCFSFYFKDKQTQIKFEFRGVRGRRHYSSNGRSEDLNAFDNYTCSLGDFSNETETKLICLCFKEAYKKYFIPKQERELLEKEKKRERIEQEKADCVRNKLIEIYKDL